MIPKSHSAPGRPERKRSHATMSWPSVLGFWWVDIPRWPSFLFHYKNSEIWMNFEWQKGGAWGRRGLQEILGAVARPKLCLKSTHGAHTLLTYLECFGDGETGGNNAEGSKILSLELTMARTQYWKKWIQRKTDLDQMIEAEPLLWICQECEQFVPFVLSHPPQLNPFLVSRSILFCENEHTSSTG